MIKFTQEQLEAKKRYAGEAVMRAAFDEGLPLIILQENGFDELAKPDGARFDACAEGGLLILASWEHHNQCITISRMQCLSLNKDGGGGMRKLK